MEEVANSGGDEWVLRRVAEVWRMFPTTRTYAQVFSATRSSGRPLHEAIDYLRAHGVAISIDVPERLTRLDEELLSFDSALQWGDLRANEPVPFARLITAARTLQRHPRERTSHLRSRGIVPSSDDLPPGLTMDEAVALIRRDHAWPILWSSFTGIDLMGLLNLSMRTGRSMAQITEWYQDWGLKVPDAAELIRDALARVPLADPS
ncbi:hypothetical protein ACIQOW_38215 [Kitasatospora sp. NPDC091335]|uniref:hypothetical protein n=1 Tax=Kitasatospora sp. NPDC091335 TaxID=3364085 RepID=UPI0038079E03